MKGLAGMERETETEGKEKHKDTPTAKDKSWSMKKGGGWVLRTCSGNSFIVVHNSKLNLSDN